MTSLGTRYEDAAGHMAPDTAIIPAQMIAPAQLSPCGRLWREVLNLAVSDTIDGALSGISGASARVRARYQQEAHTWFASPCTDIGSFRWVCEHLGLEPESAQRSPTYRGFVENDRNGR